MINLNHLNNLTWILLLQALEDIEKNFIATRQLLFGDGELEPIQEQILQFAQEICEEDIISLFIYKLPLLGWDVSFGIWSQ